jgi:hypothetical protein
MSSGSSSCCPPSLHTRSAAFSVDSTVKHGRQCGSAPSGAAKKAPLMLPPLKDHRRALRRIVGNLHFPAEEALVERARRSHIGRRELVHAQAADVVDALGSDSRARLPDREDRTLRVPEDVHAVRVQHVEGVVDRVIPELLAGQHRERGQQAGATGVDGAYRGQRRERPPAARAPCDHASTPHAPARRPRMQR